MPFHKPQSQIGAGINPHSHISSVMLYQLSYQPWEQGGGEEGYTLDVKASLWKQNSFQFQTFNLYNI